VILHLVIDGSSEMVHRQLGEILPPGSYHRLQAALADASEALDDATEANIDRLKSLAAGLIAANDRELDELCAELSR
jgi:hypothetical protein